MTSGALSVKKREMHLRTKMPARYLCVAFALFMQTLCTNHVHHLYGRACHSSIIFYYNIYKYHMYIYIYIIFVHSDETPYKYNKIHQFHLNTTAKIVSCFLLGCLRPSLKEMLLYLLLGVSTTRVSSYTLSSLSSTCAVDMFPDSWFQQLVPCKGITVCPLNGSWEVHTWA